MRTFILDIGCACGMVYVMPYSTHNNNHDGFGAGFYCPSDTCVSETAFVDYVRDKDGNLVALLLTCDKCDTQYVENMHAGAGEGEGEGSGL